MQAPEALLSTAGCRQLAPLTRKLRLLAARKLGIEAALRLDPERALRVVGSPDVLAPTLAGALPLALANFDLAFGSAHAHFHEGPFPVVSDGARAWKDVSGLLVGPAGTEVRGHEVAEPFRPMGADLELALADTNPLAMNEAHPEKAGNATDLGERSPEEWQRAFAAAIALVEQGLPGWMAGCGATRLVPVGFHPERHFSASYKEAPGLIYLSLHPEPLILAEALVHEAQHGKLNTLSWFDAVLENGHSEWTRSPVRPDERPLMGVLLAVHAFVPVALMHLSLGTDRLRPTLAKTREGLEVLKEKARPTPIGKRLLEELDTLQSWVEARA